MASANEYTVDFNGRREMIANVSACAGFDPNAVNVGIGIVERVRKNVARNARTAANRSSANGFIDPVEVIIHINFAGRDV